jgi:hypothetical protein
MSMSKPAHSIKHRIKPNDIFYTPEPLAQLCVKQINFIQGDIVLDNAYGEGAFYNNFSENVLKQKCEIQDGSDFYEWKYPVDWCVTNPPYSHLDKWLEYSCKISRKGFGYIIGWNNLTAKRIEMCNSEGFYLTKILMLKVFKWYGMSAFVVFEKNATKNIIEINRTVWR